MSGPLDVVHGGRLLARILPAEWTPEATTFFSDADDALQVGLNLYPEGHAVPPHVHPRAERRIEELQEVFVVRRGRCWVDVYTGEGDHVQSHLLEPGAVAILMRGGHGVRASGDCVLVDIKQGPFRGDEDKRRFDEPETLPGSSGTGLSANSDHAGKGEG